MLSGKEPDAQTTRQFKELYPKKKWLRVFFLMERFNHTELFYIVLSYIEPELLVKFNLVSRRFYHEIVPEVFPPFDRRWKLIRKLNEGIPE